MNGLRDHSRRAIAHRHTRAILAVAVIALLAAACASGAASRQSANEQPADGHGAFTAGPAQAPAAAASAAPSAASAAGASEQSKGGGAATANLVSALEATQIVKTGSIALEVAALDKAVSQAQAKIVGLGGYVAQSSRSGTADGATANVTFRIPVVRWDDALDAIRALATKVLNEQTSATDVTGQVVDIQARLDNLQVTEKALQGIMARASQIPDVLAVQQQLTQVQGDIEQLTAQRDRLKDQAAMSTLAVSLQLAGPPVVAAATEGWDPGAQIQDAIATLVHAGQGVATAAIWLAIVGLPLGAGLLVIGVAVWFVARRLRRSGPPRIPSEA